MLARELPFMSDKNDTYSKRNFCHPEAESLIHQGTLSPSGRRISLAGTRSFGLRNVTGSEEHKTRPQDDSCYFCGRMHVTARYAPCRATKAAFVRFVFVSFATLRGFVVQSARTSRRGTTHQPGRGVFSSSFNCGTSECLRPCLAIRLSQ